MMSTELELTLDRLAVGQTAVVVRVEGDDELSERLRDMGFWPETAVRAGPRALFGDPAVFRLRGYRLALRRAEAVRVVVRCGEATR